MISSVPEQENADPQFATRQETLAEDGTMDEHGSAVLNPQGGLAAHSAPRATRSGGGESVVIGLIDNIKPNVAYFLDAIEERIRGQGGARETVRVTKPRSAGPLPELAALAARCDYVINAVAD